MAINIYSGGGGSRQNGKINSASASTRAKAAKAALTTPSETSNSGGTAVSTSTNTLSKVGNFVGKAAGIASKFLPGIGGTIAKGLSNILNDPEWWQSVPGDAVTLNVPLRFLPVKEEVQGTEFDSMKIRPAFSYHNSCFSLAVTTSEQYVIEPSENMITQYLMPQIRKVVNAIPLQSADNYRKIIGIQATLYALWRQLKRDDFLLKHGQTYLPNLDKGFNPLYWVDNAAYLQTTINRLEEYLRANVRLPHTMCEYLAWRYGRIYKSTNSAKAALNMYNVIEPTATLNDISAFISALMDRVSSTVQLQQANTDIFNAYYDHDLMVEIRDDTQFTYDAKEFALRTNFQYKVEDEDVDTNALDNMIYIDSSLDNPTAFMASTVSTPAIGHDGVLDCLFPVTNTDVYLYYPLKEDETLTSAWRLGISTSATPTPTIDYNNSILERVGGTPWLLARFTALTMASLVNSPLRAINGASILKPVDIYNKNLNVKGTFGTNENNKETFYIDLTSLAMDCALVPDLTIANEQIYAFANLVAIDRKHSMTYKQAEKLVAKDTANFVETLDVATAKA